MGLIDPLKDWLLRIAIKKGIARIVQVGIGALGVWLTSHGTDLKQYGVDINFDTTVAVAGAVGALEVLRNWLKVKKGWNWL